MKRRIKTGCLLAALALAVTMAGCSLSDSGGEKKKPVESLPVVVAGTESEPSPSSSLGGAHCGEEGSLCGSLVNNVFEDDNRTFRITVPQDWAINQNEQIEGFIVVTSPSGDSSLEIKKQENDANLLAYTQKEFEESYAAGLQNLKVQAFEHITIQNHPAVHLSYTCTNLGIAYRFDQYLIVGDSDYNFTYASAQGSPDLSAEFQTSIQSFEEIKPQKDPQSPNGKLIGSTYTASDGTYTLSLPEGWRMVPTDGTYALAKSTDGKSNVNVRANEKDEGLLNYTQEYFKEYYSNLFQSVNITTFEKTTIGSKQALHLVCSYQYNGKSLTASQYLVDAPDGSYQLTYTCPNGVYASLAAQFQSSAESFRLS